MKEYGYLNIESNSHYSLVTVVNYGGAAPDAQLLEQPKKKLKNKKRTSKEQQKDTNNNVKKEKKEKNINSIYNSKSYISLNKNLQKEYLQLISLIDKKCDFIRANYTALKPTHFKLLRRSYSFEQIQSTITNLNNERIESSIKSLYLRIKKSLIGDTPGDSQTNESNGEKEIERIAYNEVNTIIREDLPGVASIPNQLSYDEFKSIYSKYDWNDIINKLEDLEGWKDVKKQKSLNKILQTFLTNDSEVKPLEDGEPNFFYREEKWYADTNEVDQYIKKVKSQKVMKNSKHGGSQSDMRLFIRQYLFWLKAMEDERYPDFKKLKPLTLEEAIQFEKDHMEFWGSEDNVEDLHDSPLLEKHTSSYEMILEHTQYINEED